MLYLIPRYVRQTRKGIELCLNAELVIPALALLYSAIDALGFLASTARSATRSTFTPWAERYFAPFLAKKGIRAIDLYSARCGVLHTGQAPSDLVRSGSARELWYRFDGESYVNLLTDTPTPAVLVDVEELVEAFDSAVKSFLLEIETDSALGSRAENKAEQFFRPGILMKVR